MHDLAAELLQSGDVWYHGLGVFPRCDDQPPGHVLVISRPNSPEPVNEAGPQDGLIEPGPDGEVGGVGLHVGYKLVLGRVLGKVLGKFEERKLAEVLGEMELEAVVGLVLPEGGYAVASLED